jgi:hypothetical protein
MMARSQAGGRPRPGGRRRASRAIGCALACASALSILVCPTLARASDEPVFDRGQKSYEEGQYEEAEKQFARMLDPKNPPCTEATAQEPCRLVDPDRIERARALAGASLIVIKREKEAEKLFEEILLTNPIYEPNSAQFPEKALRRFREVKTRLKPKLDDIIRKRLETKRTTDLAKLKALEEWKRWLRNVQLIASDGGTVQKNSRLVAMIPFGVGQFRNGNNSLGYFFLGSQAAVGAATIVTGIGAAYYSGIDPTKVTAVNSAGDRVSCANDTSCAQDLVDRAQTWGNVNRYLFAAWGGLIVAGIVQAQLGFVSERVIPGKREIPAEPKGITPTIAAFPGGLGLGVAGHF